MKTVCYDISSLIRKKLVLKKCPSCQGGLEHRAVERSQASCGFDQRATTPVVTASLSQCPDCGWWALRELRSDEALYDPPVEAFMVVGSSGQGCRAAPWQQVLADPKHWQHPVPIQSTDAIKLFGSAQMLLPNLNSVSGQAVFDRIKSVAPILFPVLVVIGIAVFF